MLDAVAFAGLESVAEGLELSYLLVQVSYRFYSGSGASSASCFSIADK